MITSATIARIQCETCKEFITGSFLFRFNHEQKCKEDQKTQKMNPVKETYSSNTQCNKVQGNQVIIKSSRF